MRASFLRWLARPGIALATALSLSVGPAHAFEPAPDDSAEAADLARARKDYEEGLYLPAATRFEQLHDRTKKPLFLYYAGLARENVGHDGHAILLWQRALDEGLEPDIAAKAAPRLEQARARTTALTLVIIPAQVLDGAAVELRYRGAGNRQPLVIPLAALRRPDGKLAPIHLEAGDWTVLVTPEHPAFDKSATPLSLIASAPSRTLALTLPAIKHPLTLELAPPAAVAAGITLTLHDPTGLSPDRREHLTTARPTFTLRAGEWQYTLEAPGYASATGTFTSALGAPVHPITLTFQPPTSRRAPLLPQPTRRRLALGLGLTSLAPLAAGATLTGLGIAIESRAIKQDGQYDERTLPTEPFYLAGPLLVGSAAGLVLGSAIASRPTTRAGWHGFLSTGVVLGAAGLGWNLATLPARNRAFADTPDADLSENAWLAHKANLIPSSVLIGIGAGILVASVNAIILSRKARGRPRNAAVPRSYTHGLGLRFNF